MAAARAGLKHYADFVAVSQILANKTLSLHSYRRPARACAFAALWVETRAGHDIAIDTLFRLSRWERPG